MELVRVKITKTVITARYGALSPGDMLNTDLPFAKHLVDDCKAAEFLAKPEKPSDDGQSEKEKSKSSRSKNK
jgi:hypothetical protein